MCYDCGLSIFRRKQKNIEYSTEDKNVIDKAKTAGDTDFYDIEEDFKSDYQSDTGNLEQFQDAQQHHQDDPQWQQQNSFKNKKVVTEPPSQCDNDIKHFIKSQKQKEDQEQHPQSTTSNVLHWLGSSTWWPFSENTQQNSMNHSHSSQVHSKHRSQNQLNKMQSHPEMNSHYYNAESDDEDSKQPRCLPKIFSKKSQGDYSDILNGTNRDLSKQQKNNESYKESVTEKRPAGLTVQNIDLVDPIETHSKYGPIYKQCWSSVDPQSFYVRSKDYIMNRQKISSENPVYDLKAVDTYTFDQKQFNIAKLFQLPKQYENYNIKVDDKNIIQILPPILVVNIMLPIYPPTLFSPVTNGKGHSIVYFGVLSQDYDPNETPDSMGQFQLIRDFIRKIPENDVIFGQKMKLIPRVANIDEWSNDIKMSKYYSTLMNTYNDKPFLTRPNHKFFVQPNEYWEIDFDLHVFSYFPRSVFNQFWNKINNMLFETAFVIQGDQFDELPERLLIAARVYRCEFAKERKFHQSNSESTLTSVKSSLQTKASEISTLQQHKNQENGVLEFQTMQSHSQKGQSASQNS